MLLPQRPGGEGLSSSAVSVHVVINAYCPHARLPLLTQAGSWSLLAGGCLFGRKGPQQWGPGVVGARRGPWVSSWAALRPGGWGGRAGQPRHFRRGPGEALETTPPGQWEMDPEWPAHAWISKGARVCSDQWGQRNVLSNPSTSQGHRSGLGWQCRTGKQTLPSSPCVLLRGPRAPTPMAAGVSKCPPEALASPSQARQVAHRSQGGTDSRPRPLLFLGQEQGPSRWSRPSNPGTVLQPPQTRQCAQPPAPSSEGHRRGIRQDQSG